MFRRRWQTLVNAVAEINYLYCAHFSLEHKTLFGNLRTLHYIFQCTNYGTFVCDDGLFIRVETGLTRKLLTLFFFSFFFFGLFSICLFSFSLFFSCQNCIYVFLVGFVIQWSCYYVLLVSVLHLLFVNFYPWFPSDGFPDILNCYL